MSSIFRHAMGVAFDRLHPQLRRRFSIGLHSGETCIGRGVMTRIWHAGGWIRPFLALGASRRVLLPQQGIDVPFVIENVPYTASFGRETVTFARTFAFPGGPERFDATMVLNPDRGCIVDYLGTHQHLATDLQFIADRTGALVIRSGEHRFHEGMASFRVPELIGGNALVRESYDDAAGCFRVEVSVVNRHLGPLFGYTGTFTAEFVDVAERGVRADLRPVREEIRG